MVCGAALPVDAADTVFYRNVKTIGMGDAEIEDVLARAAQHIEY